MTWAALIVAAGNSSRFNGDTSKCYLPLKGHPVLAHSLAFFQNHPAIQHIQVVIHSDHQSQYEEAAAPFAKCLPSVCGGETRQQSVQKGLEALQGCQPTHVLVHDAARPFIAKNTLEALIEKSEGYQAVIPVLPVVDTLKRVAGEQVQQTINREALYRVQTPQAFWYEALYAAHRASVNTSVTDDAQMMENAGYTVAAVPGAEQTFKITTQHDYIMAQQTPEKS